MREKSRLSFGETYHRLVRTARSVGKLAVSHSEVAEIMQRLEAVKERQYAELVDTLSEALVGRVSTEYAYEFDADERLTAADGEPTIDMLQRWHEATMLMAHEDVFYNFLPQRASAEIDELEAQEILGTEEHTALLVASVYNEDLLAGLEGDELAAAELKLKFAGQKPQLARNMIRLSFWDGERVWLLTRSIDHSPKISGKLPLDEQEAISATQLIKQACERVIGAGAVNGNTPNEILSQQHKLTLSSLDEARELIDNIVYAADDILNQVYGGVYLGGQAPEATFDSKKYVEDNQRIVESLMEQSEVLAARHEDYDLYRQDFDSCVYNATALLDQNYKRGRLKLEDIEASARIAGGIARASGITYDACGYVLSGAKDRQTEASGGLMAYLNRIVTCPQDNCGRSVFVPLEALMEGRLYCPSSEHCVDPCGDVNKAALFKLKMKQKVKRSEEDAKPKVRYGSAAERYRRLRDERASSRRRHRRS